MIDVLLHRCQPYLLKKAECRLCVKACPEGCIEFIENTVTVGKDKCTLCGVCTSVCPSGALTAKGFNDIALWEKLKEISEGARHIVFACSGEGGAGDRLKGIKLAKGSVLVSMPCVSLLKDVHLAGLLSLGIDDIWLNACCKDCGSESGRDVALKSIEYAKNIMDTFGIEGDIILSEELPQVDKGKKVKLKEILPSPHYSRREFLNVFRDKAKKLKKDHIIEDGDEVALLPDSELPERRSLLLNIAANIKEPEIDEADTGLFPIHNIDINDKCTLCDLCDLFCPTGALDRIEDDDMARVEFTLSNCVKCYQCAELCPEGAIIYLDSFDLTSFIDQDVKILKESNKGICPECNRSFLSTPSMQGTDTCRACSRKKRRGEAFLAMMGISD